ncbi:MAG: iron-containing alcohol dehydrogenase [Bacilli bacterium]
MKKFKLFFVRFVEFFINIVEHILVWKEPKLLEGYSELVDALTFRNVDNVLIVSDANCVKFGLTKHLQEKLKESDIKFTIFSDITPNPTFDNVYNGKKIYIDNKCNGIIAVGGGSTMDCAKGIGVVVNNKKPIEKYKGLFKVGHKLPLLIAIPTTSGTGSETTMAAVIRNDKTKEKFPIESFKVVPSFALLDEKLLEKLPKNVFSTTGMDALTHAIESYLNSYATKKTKKYSLDAIKLIKENIVNGYKDPTDLVAKKNMLYASFLAGKAFTRAMVGSVHAVAHALGGKYNLPHGYLNAIILPNILNIYKSVSRKKMKEMAVYAGIASDKDSESLASYKFLTFVRDLNKTFEIPTTIKEIKVKDIPELAHTSYKEAVPLYATPIIFDELDYRFIYIDLKGDINE